MALDYKLMGDRLRRARLKKGLTQEQLAETLKVSIAYVSRIETGKTRVNLKRLNQLCAVLDTTESYILDGASSTSTSYLDNELSTVLKDCSAKDKELIYQIAAFISANNSKEED